MRKVTKVKTKDIETKDETKDIETKDETKDIETDDETKDIETDDETKDVAIATPCGGAVQRYVNGNLAAVLLAGVWVSVDDTSETNDMDEAEWSKVETFAKTAIGWTDTRPAFAPPARIDNESNARYAARVALASVDYEDTNRTIDGALDVLHKCMSSGNPSLLLAGIEYARVVLATVNGPTKAHKAHGTRETRNGTGSGSGGGHRAIGAAGSVPKGRDGAVAAVWAACDVAYARASSVNDVRAGDVRAVLVERGHADIAAKSTVGCQLARWHGAVNAGHWTPGQWA